MSKRKASQSTARTSSKTTDTQKDVGGQKEFKKPKIIVVVGPTASGKSDLAVEIAKHVNGEIVSADSRQVYKGMDIGTGKITKEEMQGISHHLLDVVSPKQTFTAQQFKDKAEKAVRKILKKNKTPIICGGTGFYIQTLVDNIQFPEVPPNKKLRKELDKKTSLELFAILVEIDPKRATTIDPQNPHRLIRAIEIAKALGKVPEMKSESMYEPLFIGIQTDDDQLKERIKIRLEKRMDVGMIEEAQRLHRKGLPWKRMEELGLEYRYLSFLLRKKISRAEFTEQLTNEIWHYAKRQKTWFKRDTRINWVSLAEKQKIVETVKLFLA